MNWKLWVVVAWVCFTALMWVGKIGKPRKTVTPAMGVSGVIECAAVLALIFWGSGAVK